jgi:putative DNA primase/helicase
MWLTFLAEATGGDQALIDFLQRLAGYLLTGDVTEEMLAFIYGPGGNGKGTFLGAIASILGAY